MIVFAISIALVSQQHARLPEPLDQYVRAAIAEWEVPGAAIAVVRNGSVEAISPYGVTKLGTAEPVDAGTIFDSASLTKSFTATAIATLVDEKKLAWDDPVRKHLPTLEFSDPYLTANVTLRDLLCHRTGVAATNGIWFQGSLTREQLLHAVRSMKLDAPFRARLVYSNVGYTIAAEAAAAASGISWEDLVTKRLLIPLGMNRSTAEFGAAPALGNCASGHGLIDEKLQVFPRESAKVRSSVAACGSVQSSVADLAKWLLFQLGDGTHNGSRIVSSSSLDDIQSPHALFSATKSMRASRQVQFFGGYGLGWQVMDYRGHKYLWHTGAGDGQRAYMAMFPDDRFGVVVLLNSQKVEGLHTAIGQRVFDHYLGTPTRDYVAELKAPWLEGMAAWRAENARRESSRKKNTSTSVPVEMMTGTYRDAYDLDTTVSLDRSRLTLRYAGGEKGRLEHWEDDSFHVVWSNPYHAQRTFTLVKFEDFVGGRPHKLSMTLGRDPITAFRR